MPIFTDQHIFLKVSLLADIVVGMVGFEPTQPKGRGFTDLPSSGAYPYNNGINKTQTQLRSLNVSGYKDTAFSGLCKQINVKICNI